MKTMHPTFSIIIPHKEIPDLLMRCLQSIPVSEDIQVIVVDDNSADADTYLERYPELSRPYLEFIRTTKGVGLDHAKGKWILFADSDDFFVEDMYDIICSYVDSETDVIYFKSNSVLSADINREAKRNAHVNKIINQYLIDGDEWPIRAQMYVPWGKMVKRDVMVKHDIRFDEDELKLRAEAAFRMDKFMLQNDFCREHRLKFFLVKMLTHDRRLFKYYFFKLEEIYPSKLSALRDICKNSPRRFKIKFYLYSLLVWTRLL